MERKRGIVFSINLSKVKKVTKNTINNARLLEDFGLEGDAHGGPGLRQVSLLAIESIERQTGCTKVVKEGINLGPGDFAENITTKGLELAQLKIKDKLKIRGGIILEISKIGKECHKHCAIYERTGDCIMPREGIFARVLKGGNITIGDDIEVCSL